MPIIEFENILGSVQNDLSKCFDLIKKSKSETNFDEGEIWVAFPKYAQKNFVRLEKGDLADKEWDFLSWIDAIKNSAIEYQALEFSSKTTGKLSFEQLSWPSGGLEATEELIKVFGGNVGSNNAI